MASDRRAFSKSFAPGSISGESADGLGRAMSGAVWVATGIHSEKTPPTGSSLTWRTVSRVKTTTPATARPARIRIKVHRLIGANDSKKSPPLEVESVDRH